MPEGSFVGTLPVYDMNPNSKGGHMINYFSFPNKKGFQDIVAYDQQSGAMSKPHPSFEDAVSDPQFSARTNARYKGVNFKVIHPERQDAPSRVLPETIDSSTSRPGEMTPRQDVANFFMPKLFKGELPDPERSTVQIGSAGSYSPTKPNYLWQSMDGNQLLPRIGRAFGFGYIKDGTHGKYLAPENAEWYAPMRR